MAIKLDTQKLAQLYERIIKFNEERGWKPSASNLAKSIVIESAELLEIFQWHDQYPQFKELDDEKKVHLLHEVADVLWYVFDFCHEMGIDPVEALECKYQHNVKKYPAEAFKNSHNSEFYYQQKQKYRLGKK